LLLETNTASDSRDILKAKNSAGTVFNLQADGKLGIGTEVPNETLTVSGKVSALGSLSATNNITIERPGTTGRSELVIKGKGNSSGDHVGMVAFKSYSEGDPLASIKAIRHNADDVGCMAFATSDSERVRIDNNGNVGIGETVPGEKLTVAGNISALGSLSAGLGEHVAVCNSSYGGFISGGRDLADIFETCSSSVDGTGTACFLPVWSDTDTIGNSIACQSSTQLTVAGNISACGGLSATEMNGYFACSVGIGTNRPSEKLELGNGGKIGLKDSAGTYDSVIYNDGTTFKVADGAGSYHVDKINLLGLLDLGVGHTIKGIDNSIIANKDILAPKDGSFGFRTYGATNQYDAISSQFIDNNNNALSFNVKSGGTTSGAVRIDKDGNVGIGTTTPNEKLTVSGNISACGGLSADGAIRVPDSTCITLGDSEDLELSHNGSTSFIKDKGTGNLEIWGDGELKIMSGDGSETKATFDTNGAVDLYYDNSQKFETTSTGSKTSGSICATNDLNVDGDASVRALTVSRGASVTRGVSASSTHNGFVSAGRDLSRHLCNEFR
jgi:flagellar hook assembly protein FlgD